MLRTEACRSSNLATHAVVLLSLSALVTLPQATLRVTAEEASAPDEETASSAWFALPPDLLAVLGDGEPPRRDLEVTRLPGGATMVHPEGLEVQVDGDGGIRIVAQDGPMICLASDPSCEAARQLAAIPCTRADTCRPLQEYRSIWGEPGIRPAPSPAGLEPGKAQDSDRSGQDSPQN